MATVALVPDIFPMLYIKFIGQYDQDALFQTVADYFKRYRYELWEHTYKHKHKSTGATQEIIWLASRKSSDLMKEEVEIYFKTWEVNEVEPPSKEHGRIVHARLHWWIQSLKIIDDWQGQFTGSPFKRFMISTYKKAYTKELSASYYDVAYLRLYNLHTLVKKFLGMETKFNKATGLVGQNR